MSLVAPRCQSRRLNHHQQQHQGHLASSHLQQNAYLQPQCHPSTAQQSVHNPLSSSSSIPPSYLTTSDHLSPTSNTPPVSISHAHHPQQHAYGHPATAHPTLGGGMHHLSAPYAQLSAHPATNVLPPPRSYYVVSWVPRALPEVVQLIKEIPTEAERCLINKHFELGMLVMRRCGVQNPEEIKCLLDGFREGTTRLSAKEPPSKNLTLDDSAPSSGGVPNTEGASSYSNNLCCSPTVERRRLLIFFNDHRASRPWVLCPAKHCIKSARTTGKVKGRVKILQFDQRSTTVKIPKLFMDCLSDFLTRDHYVFATFCPQQKYTDHELEWFDLPERATGATGELGGDVIFRELVEEHDTKGAQRIWPFEDYIIFSNSQAKIVAVFKKKQPLLSLYRNHWSGFDDCSSVTTTASSIILGPFVTSQSGSGSPPLHPRGGNIGVCGTRLTSCSSDGCSTPTAGATNFGALHGINRLAHCSSNVCCLGPNETNVLNSNLTVSSLRPESSLHGMTMTHAANSQQALMCSSENSLSHPLIHALGGSPMAHNAVSGCPGPAKSAQTSSETQADSHNSEMPFSFRDTAGRRRRTRSSMRRSMTKSSISQYEQPNGSTEHSNNDLNCEEDESEKKFFFSSSPSSSAASSSSSTTERDTDQNQRRKKRRKHQTKTRVSVNDVCNRQYDYSPELNLTENGNTMPSSCSMSSSNTQLAVSADSNALFYTQLNRASNLDEKNNPGLQCSRPQNEFYSTPENGSIIKTSNDFCLDVRNDKQPIPSQSSNVPVPAAAMYDPSNTMCRDAIAAAHQQHQLGQTSLQPHAIHPLHPHPGASNLKCNAMSTTGLNMLNENTPLNDACHPLNFHSNPNGLPININNMPPDVIRQAEEAELVLIKVMTRVLAHLEPLEDPSNIDLGLVYHNATTMELNSRMPGTPAFVNDVSFSRLHAAPQRSFGSLPTSESLGQNRVYYNDRYTCPPDNPVMKTDQTNDCSQQPPRNNYALQSNNKLPSVNRPVPGTFTEDAVDGKPQQSVCGSNDTNITGHSNSTEVISAETVLKERQAHTADSLSKNSAISEVNPSAQMQGITEMTSVTTLATTTTASTATTTTCSLATATDTGHDDDSSAPCFPSSGAEGTSIKEADVKQDNSLVSQLQQPQQQRAKLEPNGNSAAGGLDGEGKPRRKVITFPSPTNAVLYHDLVRQFLSRLAFGLDHPPLPQKRIPDTVKRVVTKIVTETIRDINLALLTSSIRCHSELPSRSYGILGNNSLTASADDVASSVSARSANTLAPNSLMTQPFGSTSVPSVSVPSFWGTPPEMAVSPSGSQPVAMNSFNNQESAAATLENAASSSRSSSLLLPSSAGAFNIMASMYSSRYDLVHNHGVGPNGNASTCYVGNDGLIPHFVQSSLLHRGGKPVMHSGLSDGSTALPAGTGIVTSTTSDSGGSSGPLFAGGPAMALLNTCATGTTPYDVLSTRMSCTGPLQGDPSHSSPPNGLYYGSLSGIPHPSISKSESTSPNTDAAQHNHRPSPGDNIMEMMAHSAIEPLGMSVRPLDSVSGGRNDTNHETDERRRLGSMPVAPPFSYGSQIPLPSPLLFEEYMAAAAAAAVPETSRINMPAAPLLSNCVPNDAQHLLGTETHVAPENGRGNNSSPAITELSNNNLKAENCQLAAPATDVFANHSPQVNGNVQHAPQNLPPPGSYADKQHDQSTSATSASVTSGPQVQPTSASSITPSSLQPLSSHLLCPQPNALLSMSFKDTQRLSTSSRLGFWPSSLLNVMPSSSTSLHNPMEGLNHELSQQRQQQQQQLETISRPEPPTQCSSSSMANSHQNSSELLHSHGYPPMYDSVYNLRHTTYDDVRATSRQTSSAPSANMSMIRHNDEHTDPALASSCLTAAPEPSDGNATALSPLRSHHHHHPHHHHHHPNESHSLMHVTPSASSLHHPLNVHCAASPCYAAMYDSDQHTPRTVLQQDAEDAGLETSHRHHKALMAASGSVMDIHEMSQDPTEKTLHESLLTKSERSPSIKESGAHLSSSDPSALGMPSGEWFIR